MTNDLDRWSTWKELSAQPSIWREWAQTWEIDAHRRWNNDQQFDEVWFCGAGTSAYIGDIIVAGLEDQRGDVRFRSIPSTDLVAQPKAYLKGRRPLVVSFGRSGNSSETIGTLDALDTLAPDAPRLNITCNSQSALAQRNSQSTHVIVLPEATHDVGFAMTSSFSTMLYSALTIFSSDDGDQNQMQRAAVAFEGVFGDYQNAIASPPERVVFLGTGALTFAARECALKGMELSAGQIPCIWDSVLGFRHGPKSFVTKNTTVAVFTSNEQPACHYEADLISEIRTQYPRAQVVSIGPGGDIDLQHPDGPAWAAPVAIAFAQIAGVIWSDKLGLNVDNPFHDQNTLTRVVSGVKLYEVGS